MAKSSHDEYSLPLENKIHDKTSSVIQKEGSPDIDLVIYARYSQVINQINSKLNVPKKNLQLALSQHDEQVGFTPDFDINQSIPPKPPGDKEFNTADLLEGGIQQAGDEGFSTYQFLQRQKEYLEKCARTYNIPDFLSAKMNNISIHQRVYAFMTNDHIELLSAVDASKFQGNKMLSMDSIIDSHRLPIELLSLALEENFGAFQKGVDKEGRHEYYSMVEVGGDFFILEATLDQLKDKKILTHFFLRKIYKGSSLEAKVEDIKKVLETMKSSRDSISHSNENEKYLTKEIKFGDKNFKVYQLFCKEENNAELSDGFQQTRSNRKKESKRKVQVEGDPNDARSLLLELVSLREKSTKVNNIIN